MPLSSSIGGGGGGPGGTIASGHSPPLDGAQPSSTATSSPSRPVLFSLIALVRFSGASILKEASLIVLSLKVDDTTELQSVVSEGEYIISGGGASSRKQVARFGVTMLLSSIVSSL